MAAVRIRGFTTAREEENALKDLVGYFDRIQKERDFTLPSQSALTYLSAKTDQAVKNAYDSLAKIVIQSKEHEKRVVELKKQPRTVGKSSLSKAILKGASSFEQILALESWLSKVAIRQKHTFCLATEIEEEESYIPASAKSQSLMHVVLGATRGKDKAPKYSEWAQNDPWQTSQAKFVYPLESLEMVRQPLFVAATVLKGNAFERNFVDQSWRYGTEKACVEDRGQSRDSPKKNRSAGLNFTALTQHLAMPSLDGDLSDMTICQPILCSNYVEEGYRDDLHIEVTPQELIQAADKAIRRQQDEEMNQLAMRLLVAKLETPTTPLLRNHVVKTLFS